MKATGRTVEKATKEVVLEPPQIIEVDGHKFKFVDFNNEWTFMQENDSIPIAQKLVKVFNHNIDLIKSQLSAKKEIEDLNDKLDNMPKNVKEKYINDELTKFSNDNITRALKMSEEMLSQDNNLLMDMLPILYIPEKDLHYDSKKYEENKSILSNINMIKYPKVRDSIQSFLSLKVLSIVKDSLTLLNQSTATL